jgi:glycosyltransferase involved in cell wall biosynthesis
VGARVCLVTTGQPSTNPRLVKEADALAASGYAVDVICAYWVDWASDADRALLTSRRWSPAYVGSANGFGRLWRRVRHAASREGLSFFGGNAMLQEASVSRVAPDLRRAALARPADLYVAHNLGALPAAAAAARRHRGRIGFDAEDFHSGERPHAVPATSIDRAVEAIERRYLPLCDYTTAASPGIAEAYATKYRIPCPTTILNVFPRAHRPATFRERRADDEPLRLYWFSQTIGPQRGLEDAVDAMGQLGQVPVELHLRGSWQEGYRERIVERCRARGVDPARVISHDPASPDEMVRLAAPCDVGLALEHPVSRNREICLTNKIFTYLLAGVAVAATATDGQAAVLPRLGEAAFAYRPGDASALAAGLHCWWKDRGRLEAARRAAWRLGEREFNWDIEQTTFLRVVERALGRQPEAARQRA